MRTLRFSDRRIINTVASLGLLTGMLLPAVVPAFASAAEITTRSIDMSTSASGATGVSYTVTFTPVTSAAGYVIDFCSQTSIPGDTCTAPTGLSTSAIGTSTGGATVAALSSHSAAAVTVSLTAATPDTVVLTGMQNPSSVGQFYARIVTYDTTGDLATPTGNSTETTGATDSGGVALSIDSTIGVSAAVLESMTFCVAGSDTSISADQNCSDSTLLTDNPPSLVLGVSSGGTTALQSGTLSTGTVYTQLSTNAAHGAVVSMKSNATGCGGLILAGTSGCFISPASGSFSAGTADFGVKTGTAVGTASDSAATGTYQATNGYNSSTYLMNFTAGGSPSTGVTSTYGDPILNSDSLPVNDENMPLTFGASISNATPAGNYSANLNLIASGTF